MTHYRAAAQLAERRNQRELRAENAEMRKALVKIANPYEAHVVTDRKIATAVLEKHPEVKTNAIYNIINDFDVVQMFPVSCKDAKKEYDELLTERTGLRDKLQLQDDIAASNNAAYDHLVEQLAAAQKRVEEAKRLIQLYANRHGNTLAVEEWLAEVKK